MGLHRPLRLYNGPNGHMKNKIINENLTLIDNFQKYFSVNFAGSLELKRKVYDLRFRVYCEEFAYEAISDFPDKMEYDEYDASSLHCLIIHKPSNLPAACVRLVPASGIFGEDRLPIEKYCGDSLDHTFLYNLSNNRDVSCEISRLAVNGIFRKRSGETASRFGELNSQDNFYQGRRSFPLLAVACFLASTALTDLTHRTNVYAMMEPFLQKLMKRSGIVFQKAGSDINYHGHRAPHFIKTQSAIENMRPELKDFYYLIRSQIAEECQLYLQATKLTAFQNIDWTQKTHSISQVANNSLYS